MFIYATYYFSFLNCLPDKILYFPNLHTCSDLHHNTFKYLTEIFRIREPDPIGNFRYCIFALL